MRITDIPREAAEFDPNAKASSARECQRQTARPKRVAGTARYASGQRTPDRFPSSQNIIPRACSAVAAFVTMKDVSALKSCEPATPARMMAVVPLPVFSAKRLINENAVSAPRKAPSGRLRMPVPKPSIATLTAPVEAPAEMPRM
ncbi:hypothetical protein D9M72_524190 [compost metagenome]